MALFAFDNEYRKQGYVYLAATDEAGRGPLAGPVVAAAVVLPPRFFDERINDSKKLSDSALVELSALIKAHALSYNIAFVDAATIDEINIYAASKRAMFMALSALTHEYDFVLTDAMELQGLKVPHAAIVKGDAQSFSIACASILAKVARDEYMVELDAKYPQYGFAAHKGYPTKKHLYALEQFGPLENVHRFSYKPVKAQAYKQIKLF